MVRETPSQVSNFKGLNLNKAKILLDSKELVEANNVYIDDGQIKLRPGRNELTENQLAITIPLGIADYNDPSSNRKLVLVMSDGIYVRS